MKKILYLWIFFGIVGLDIPVPASNPVPASPNSPASPTFESYRQDCLQRSKREGLANDVANDLCNCTIKKFQASYSLQQFRALVQKSKTDKTAARSLTAVGEACFDEVLYEN